MLTHDKIKKMDAIVVKNTPTATPDNRPRLPRLVLPSSFRFFGPFQVHARQIRARERF